MTRLARDFSWHLLALVMIVAGLGVLAPLTWWHAPPAVPRQMASRRALSGSAGKAQSELPPAPTIAAGPQLATLRPQIADDIRLDPSITETPALPTGPTTPEFLGPNEDKPEELRLSANAARASINDLPDLRDLPPLQQPTQVPSLAPESQSPVPLPRVTKAWAFPAGLIEQLNILSATAPQSAQWVERVQAELERLVGLDTLADPAVGGILANLRSLAEQVKSVPVETRDDQTRSKLLRAGYAIVRRLVIWDQVHALAREQQVSVVPIVDRQASSDALGEVDNLLQATGAAANWRKYLLVDRARDQFDSSSCSPADQRLLARDMLHRMHSTQLSYEQIEFLKTPPFAELTKHLEARAAVTPDFVGLLSSIEEYEHEDLSQHARTLAYNYDALRWSPSAEVRDLAESLNSYYRNANVRVALSSELINRMIPPQTPQVEPVEDVILGASVSGQSQTNTSLKLALIPDREKWNIGLEANGQVASNTSSSKGPATFFQNGWSLFHARKRLTVDRRGIRLFSSEANADANNSLDDFETDFDGIPLLGGIARAIARSQYDESQPAAKVEVEGRIIGRATTQLDREVASKLQKAKLDFQVKISKPLQQLNLEPTAVDMETTADRLIARYRVASREQLAAYTPRPQAPGDSILSVQVHETALNNVLDKLQLAGRKVELHQLYQEMTLRFRREKVPVPDDLPEDVYVTFADEDPVRLDCQDGRIRLTIRLKELAQGTKNRWVNFTVRGYYVPNADQLEANLVRDGVIELIGDGHQIPFGQQIALRGIFSRVLSRNRKLHIVNKQIAEAKELRDQQVTQFVIHDGWVGIALGPKAPGRQAAMHPRPDIKQE